MATSERKSSLSSTFDISGGETGVAEACEVLAAIDRLVSSGTSRSQDLASEHDFHLVIAAHAHLRQIAWRMVYAMYLRKGYVVPQPQDEQDEWRDLFDALPTTHAYLLFHSQQPTGTMSAFLDNPAGLPAEAAFAEEIGRLRRPGRTLCEFGRLAHAADTGEQANSSLVVALALFRAGFLHAKHLLGVTDLVLTVNPRHVQFYERRILCSVVSETRAMAKVNRAPAVLLHLDLLEAESRYAKLYGSDPQGLWHFFFHPKRIAALLNHLFVRSHPLDPLVVDLFFGAEARAALLVGSKLAEEVIRCWPLLADDSDPDGRHGNLSAEGTVQVGMETARTTIDFSRHWRPRSVSSRGATGVA